MNNPLLINAVVVALLMIVTWFVSVWRRDASIVDPVWGAGFVCIAVASVVQQDAVQSSQVVLLCMVTIWGCRLAGYLTWRKLKESEEDYRYRAMREYHGSRFWWVSLLTVFLLQGIIMWFVALPVQFSLTTNEISQPSILLHSAGIVVWLVGLLFETFGDWQLHQFKSNPTNEGKVLDTGLWRYTRHPNYFGDFAVWWGLWLVSFAIGCPLWTIVCPLLMSVLLMKVSGVTLTEKTITTRRPNYADYQRRTNAFFPWFPNT